ncbi:helix-turn-helix domain-containing protein [Xanthobacter flavus]|uniref:helix-turn-helix domain-containing protein n=1 Tax=Xanthobacter flavus TaxID=281 RepID=UPI0037271DF0
MDPDLRRAALSMIACGEASPAEVADALGVSRQVVHRWVTVAGIDWVRARQARVLKAITKRREERERRRAQR